MRKQIKLAALAAAAGMVAASAQAANYNSDLIVGFTSGSGSDFVYDLGAESSLTAGETWNLSSFLGSFTLSSVQWGVIGDKLNIGTAWATTTGLFTPGTIGNLQTLSPIDSATATIYGNLPAAGAGQNASVDHTFDASWNVETINPDLDSDYVNQFVNPNVTGEVSDYFYSVKDNGSDPTLVGNFSLDGSGTLTFNPVPEPSTIGLITGAGLLMLALRNKFRRI
jgi:hypothetical protein